MDDPESSLELANNSSEPVSALNEFQETPRKVPESIEQALVIFTILTYICLELTISFKIDLKIEKFINIFENMSLQKLEIKSE
jgi:hypothetical protein